MPTYEFPEVADKYDITEKLGQGTYAVVYKAVPKDPALGEEAIALKRFKVWHNKPSRILNEAEMLAQCGCAPAHPAARARAHTRRDSRARARRCVARRGENYVVELRDVLRVKCDTSFLLPYFKHDSFRVCASARAYAHDGAHLALTALARALGAARRRTTCTASMWSTRWRT